jgi:hypothetical protein
MLLWKYHTRDSSSACLINAIDGPFLYYGLQIWTIRENIGGRTEAAKILS